MLCLVEFIEELVYSYSFPIFYRVIFCCKPEYAYGYHCVLIVNGSLSGLKNVEKYKFHPVTLTVFSWEYLITLALEGFL